MPKRHCAVCGLVRNAKEFKRAEPCCRKCSALIDRETIEAAATRANSVMDNMLAEDVGNHAESLSKEIARATVMRPESRANIAAIAEAMKDRVDGRPDVSAIFGKLFVKLLEEAQGETLNGTPIKNAKKRPQIVLNMLKMWHEWLTNMEAAERLDQMEKWDDADLEAAAHTIAMDLLANNEKFRLDIVSSTLREYPELVQRAAERMGMEMVPSGKVLEASDGR